MRGDNVATVMSIGDTTAVLSVLSWNRNTDHDDHDEHGHDDNDDNSQSSYQWKLHITIWGFEKSR